jgi:hypothetical protein
MIRLAVQIPTKTLELVCDRLFFLKPIVVNSSSDSTLQDVRLQLSKEDAEEAARGVISAHQTSMSSFLMTGIELEEQQ